MADFSLKNQFRMLFCSDTLEFVSEVDEEIALLGMVAIA